MTAHATVGIDNDLTTGEAGISFRTTGHEASGWVDEILGVITEKLTGDDFFNEVTLEDLPHFRSVDLSGMHRGNDDRSDAHRLSIDILHRNLGLGIRTKPGVNAVFAKIGQGLTQSVGIRHRSRHQFLGIVGGVTKHDALVSGSLLGGILVVGRIRIHALRDVLRLLAKKVHEEEAIGIKLRSIGILGVIGVRFVVANLTDSLAGHFFVIELGPGRDFTGNGEDIVLHKSLTSHAGLGVLLKAGVEDSVGHGITDFVWMPFGDGF